MTLWNFDINFLSLIKDFMYLSIFLILGTVCRRYGKFFQKYLIPNNIIAGFIGLIVGPQVLGLLDLNMDHLGAYVYHLLALTFVAMGLRQEKTSWGKGPLSFGITMLSSYIVQAVVGLLVAFAFIYTTMPKLSPSIGLLLPMGFGMGPGQAFTMGKAWESFGLEGGAATGLTIAAIGYLIAYFGGIIIINRGIKNRETNLIKGLEGITEDMRTGVVKHGKPEIGSFLTLSQEAIEPLAFHIGLIGVVYWLTWVLTSTLVGFMESHGAVKFAATVWAFHFVLALLVAIIVRKLLDITKKSYMIDVGLMNRTAGLFVDFLVVGSICAISLTVVWKYWAPLFVMSVFGTIVTYILLRYVCNRAFDDYKFERFVGIFGEMTGTLNSGLVLVRVTDPDFKTPVAEDLVYSSGVALFLGLPLLILLNAPMNFFGNTYKGYWITLGLLILYGVILWVFWRLIGFIKLTKPNFKKSK
ncbi:MAG: hypothetical protein PHW79_09055 [Candidatus Marinimicrobia bacterium]|nr:hypothetical protein [Candidatus Neomarinimicrobiota bacterium]